MTDEARPLDTTMTTICFLCNETPGPSPSVEFVSHDLGYAHPYCLAIEYFALRVRLEAREQERDIAVTRAERWKRTAKAVYRQACDLSDEYNKVQSAQATTAKRAARLQQALVAILAEPYGCSLCDSGTPRDPAKGHQSDCPYEVARAATQETQI